MYLPIQDVYNIHLDLYNINVTTTEFYIYILIVYKCTCPYFYITAQNLPFEGKYPTLLISLFSSPVFVFIRFPLFIYT